MALRAFIIQNQSVHVPPLFGLHPICTYFQSHLPACNRSVYFYIFQNRFTPVISSSSVAAGSTSLLVRAHISVKTIESRFTWFKIQLFFFLTSLVDPTISPCLVDRFKPSTDLLTPSEIHQVEQPEPLLKRAERCVCVCVFTF